MKRLFIEIKLGLSEVGLLGLHCYYILDGEDLVYSWWFVGRWLGLRDIISKQVHIKWALVCGVLGGEKKVMWCVPNSSPLGLLVTGSLAACLTMLTPS